MPNIEEPRTDNIPDATPSQRRLSLDWWAVITSLALTALVWGGVLRKVPW